ncbi:DUF2007 domain-containing protein [uncultured Sunxiuqinia sp.]|uniref:putative signal transducing protein n=1 Tax=uncultured Sunxiuqinia sp. TaxID=1573825 RepID=UPI002AA7C964|nr:DUF2007 domain-containing protein [uncultured Sunxiuqinia sp.]
MQKAKTVRIFTGNKVDISYIKAELEKQGIPSVIQDDFNSGTIAGFSGGIPTAIDLYIQEENFAQASSIIKDLTQTS